MPRSLALASPISPLVGGDDQIVAIFGAFLRQLETDAGEAPVTTASGLALYRACQGSSRVSDRIVHSPA